MIDSNNKLHGVARPPIGENKRDSRPQTAQDSGDTVLLFWSGSHEVHNVG